MRANFKSKSQEAFVCDLEATIQPKLKQESRMERPTLRQIWVDGRCKLLNCKIVVQARESDYTRDFA